MQIREMSIKSTCSFYRVVLIHAAARRIPRDRVAVGVYLYRVFSEAITSTKTNDDKNTWRTTIGGQN